MSRPSRCVVLALVPALVLAACTRPENAVPDGTQLPSASVPATSATGSSVDDAPGGAAVTTTPASTDTTDTTDTGPSADTTDPADAPTTAATASTAVSTSASTEPSTDAATTTTVQPTTPADLTLHFDGVLPYRFGEHDTDVVTGLAGALGSPVADVSTEYPTADEGVFLDETGEEAYVSPFGRSVCFTIGLCLQFGAGTRDTLIFTGWRLDGDGSAELATEDGISIGSTLADHADVVTFDPAVSCYQVAFGAAAGIDVTLLSDDGVFAAPNAAGDGLDLGDPDPALVTIQSMSAGELPVFLFADC